MSRCAVAEAASGQSRGIRHPPSYLAAGIRGSCWLAASVGGLGDHKLEIPGGAAGRCLPGSPAGLVW